MARKPNTKCYNCGNPCYIRPNQLESQAVWFCSRDCHDAFRKENRVGQCAECSEKFRRKNAEQRYCSRSCANRSRRGIKYDGQNTKNKASQNARRRELVTNAYGPNCAICDGEPVWLGKPLVHQVDHIDGDNKNHALDNLRLLCPNCHTQTDTYGTKNIGRFLRR